MDIEIQKTEGHNFNDFFNSYSHTILEIQSRFVLFIWMVGWFGVFLIEKDVPEYFSHLSVIICF